MKLSLLSSNIMLERANRKAKFRSQLDQLDKTQSELADDVGVHKSTISRYKKGGDTSKGGRQPSLDTLRLLAKQGIDVVDLFGIKSDPDDAPKHSKSVKRVVQRPIIDPNVVSYENPNLSGPPQ
jgi:transcriptional regulator with XRE-family HTH domain